MRISDWSSDVCSSDLTATAGTLTLRNRDGARSAALYYTAYTVAGAAPPTDPATRPLTFVFNGGPGAASAYLHLGLVGPRIVEFGSPPDAARSEEHTSELQSLMRLSYAFFFLKKKKQKD